MSRLSIALAAALLFGSSSGAQVSDQTPASMPPKLAVPMPAQVKPNGLALTPPMGWNSWNKFRNQVSDKLVRETADAMVRTGMRDAGYIYLNVDDTWEAGRDAAGNIQTNDRFPDMKAMIDYVHGKGLRFGIYSSPGPKTCAGYEGSYQHEDQDAKTYAAWGVDYLKYDWCTGDAVYQHASEPGVYAKMARPCSAPAAPSCSAFASTARCKSRPGALRSAAIYGAPLEISAIHGIRCLTSASISRWVSRVPLAPATGMIPTCSKSATAE